MACWRCLAFAVVPPSLLPPAQRRQAGDFGRVCIDAGSDGAKRAEGA